ncbi:hypothetical protein IE53DRAFT_409441 [Violaceomyces palustris]|uniref:Uncharacterized protein n=1 Tax=Violaceomyces palustris TaxID=1673888 RepID=A0ACD0P2T3_9BASI|nr:hypothetical protein IE53DRAFT_409441 [Violaceomyces palustris]
MPGSLLSFGSLFKASSSIYPTKTCFFCRNESVILPPFDHSQGQTDIVPNRNSSSSASASSSNLAISTGTPTNWYCSSCECWNTTDQDGRFKDQWTREMWDLDWNLKRNQFLSHLPRKKFHQAPVPRHASSSRHQEPTFGAGVGGLAKSSAKSIHTSTPQPSHSSPFCHICRTNQMVQLNLLSDYLPEEEDPEYAEKLDSFQRYKSSLSERYPPLCQDCSPQVMRTLEERDQMVRSWTMGRWLERRFKAGDDRRPHHSEKDTRSQVGEDEDGSAFNGRLAKADAALPASRRERRMKDLIWVLRAACYLVSSFVLWSISAFALFGSEASLQEALSRIEQQCISHGTVMRRSLGGISLLVSSILAFQAYLWDPTARKVLRARMRGSRPTVSGLDRWKANQFTILILRSSAILLLSGCLVQKLGRSGQRLTDFVSSPGDLITLRLVFLCYSALDFALFYFSISKLRVTTSTTLRLVSKSSHAQAAGEAATVFRTGRGGEGLDPLSSLSLRDEDPVWTLSNRRSGRNVGSKEEGRERDPDRGPISQFGLENLLSNLDREDPVKPSWQKDRDRYGHGNQDENGGDHDILHRLKSKDADGDEIMNPISDPAEQGEDIQGWNDLREEEEENPSSIHWRMMNPHSRPYTIAGTLEGGSRDPSRGDQNPNTRFPGTRQQGTGHVFGQTVPTLRRSGGSGKSLAREIQLGPQRFWEPQKPTGLEEVFGR